MQIKNFPEFCEQILPDFNQFLNDRLTTEIKQATLRDAMLYSLRSSKICLVGETHKPCSLDI